jgi:hypothetical protein
LPVSFDLTDWRGGAAHGAGFLIVELDRQRDAGDANAHALPAWMRRRAIFWRQITITLVALARRCTGECQHDTAAVLARRG